MEPNYVEFQLCPRLIVSNPVSLGLVFSCPRMCAGGPFRCGLSDSLRSSYIPETES